MKGLIRSDPSHFKRYRGSKEKSLELLCEIEFFELSNPEDVQSVRSARLILVSNRLIEWPNGEEQKCDKWRSAFE